MKTTKNAYLAKLTEQIQMKSPQIEEGPLGPPSIPTNTDPSLPSNLADKEKSSSKKKEKVKPQTEADSDL